MITVAEVMKEPEVVKLLTDQQVTVFWLGRADFATLIKSDLEKWARVIKAAGIKVEESH